MRGHRVVLLSQGPDLPLFANPATLARLARWLVDAMRERISGTRMAYSAPGGANHRNAQKGKSLPFVVACLDEKRGVYVVVGVNAALEFGDVRKKWVVISTLHEFWTLNSGVPLPQQ
jgi:cell division control protein 45